MTPTEQDSNGDGILKQRIYEEIAVIFAGKDLSHEQIAALMDDRKESVELIMRLITADRKRVALEARIAELNKIALDTYRGKTVSESTNWQAKFEYFMDSNERRIAGLKARQEEGE